MLCYCFYHNIHDGNITTSSCQVFIADTSLAYSLFDFYVIKRKIPGRVKIEDMFDINIKTHKKYLIEACHCQAQFISAIVYSFSYTISNSSWNIVEYSYKITSGIFFIIMILSIIFLLGVYRYDLSKWFHYVSIKCWNYDGQWTHQSLCMKIFYLKSTFIGILPWPQYSTEAISKVKPRHC